MKTSWAATVLAVMALSAIARAAVSVRAGNTCSGPAITDTSIVEVTQSDGKWEVRFKPVASGDYWVCGAAGDVIRIITADTPEAAVTVHTVGTQAVISAIEEIRVLGQGTMNIGTVRVVDRIGPATPTTAIGVLVNNIELLESLNGSLNCAVASRLGGRNPGGNLGFINFPEATIRADIRNDNASGRIARIDCKNIEGTSTAPVTIHAVGQLTTLNVGRFDANNLPIGGDALFVRIGDPSIPLASRTMAARDLTFARDFNGLILLRALEVPAFGGENGTGYLRTGRDFTGVLDIAEGLRAYPGSDPTSLTCVQQVRIGRTFTQGSLIHLPAIDGPTIPLASQIVINDGRFDALSNTWISQGGQWLGSVGFGYASGGGPQVIVQPDPNAAGECVSPYPSGPNEVGDVIKEDGQDSVGGIGVVGYKIEGTRSRIYLLRAGTTCHRVVTESTINEVPRIDAVMTPERIQINLATYGETLRVPSTNFNHYVLLRTRRLQNEQGVYGTLFSCAEVVDDFGCSKITENCRARLFHGPLESTSECLKPADIGGILDWCAGTHVFDNGYRYIFKVRSEDPTRSRAAGLTSSPNCPPVDTQDALVWDVGCDCLADLVPDGVVNTSDLTKFLSQFGLTQQGCTGQSPILLGDLNADNVVNTLDVTLFISEFGRVCCIIPTPPPLCQACPGSQLERPGSSEAQSTQDAVAARPLGGIAEASTHIPTPPGPVLAALGFSSAEAFQSYVDTLSTEELKVYLVLVVAVAQNLDAGTP